MTKPSTTDGAPDAKLAAFANQVQSAAASMSALIGALAKLGLLVMMITLVTTNWRALEGWLLTITSIEFAGLKVDRRAATETLRELLRSRSQGADLVSAEGAIARASHAGAAVAGARLLWVDNHPETRRAERSVLEQVGIRIQLALTPDEAMRLIALEPFDLIVSRIEFDGAAAAGQPPAALSKCQAHAFELRRGQEFDPQTFAQELAAENHLLSSQPPLGFLLAERLASLRSTLVGRGNSALIFYSGFAPAGILANQCARLITDRVDVLLHGVVSALEEQRWRLLPGRPSVPDR